MTLFDDGVPCIHGRVMELCPFCVTRSTDPDTSLAAAESALTNAGTIRGRVLQLLEHYALTDDEILHRFQMLEWSGSPSGLRTRRAELVAAGLVRRAEQDGVTDSGRGCARWETT